MLPWITAATLLLLLARPVFSNPIETIESGSSTIRVNGAIVAEQSDAQTDGRVSVFAIHGSLATPEVRTAARSSVSGEMAANVRMDDKSQFSRTQVTETISAATLIVHVAPDNAFLRRAELDFFLPPSFLEVTSNAEVRSNALEMVLLASLRVCFATICGIGDEQFGFQSILTASWQAFNNSINVDGDAALDLSPLQNPTVTDVGGPGPNPELLRTTTIDFPAFQGHLDLGLIPAGVPLTLEYQMQARGSGLLLANIGLAAINDPFLLSTDPVLPGVALDLAVAPQAPVPVPATWMLLLAGLALVPAFARRRPGSRCGDDAAGDHSVN